MNKTQKPSHTATRSRVLLRLLARAPRLHGLVANRLKRRRVGPLPCRVLLAPHERLAVLRRAMAVQLPHRDAAFGKRRLVTNGAGLIVRGNRLGLLADPYIF